MCLTVFWVSAHHHAASGFGKKSNALDQCQGDPSGNSDKTSNDNDPLIEFLLSAKNTQ